MRRARASGTGRRAGQRFDADYGVTTEAVIFLNELDPEDLGANADQATHYEPTPVDEARALLACVAHPESFAFVDVGSGMGRVVILAREFPFRQIVGIELAGALHEVAVANLRAAPSENVRCRDVRLQHVDAARARYPRGDCVLYLYNPFRAEVLRAVIERVMRERRDVVVLYHTPIERVVLDDDPRFVVTSDLGFGVVYRAEARPQAAEASPANIAATPTTSWRMPR